MIENLVEMGQTVAFEVDDRLYYMQIATYGMWSELAHSWAKDANGIPICLPSEKAVQYLIDTGNHVGADWQVRCWEAEQ